MIVLVLATRWAPLSAPPLSDVPPCKTPKSNQYFTSAIPPALNFVHYTQLEVIPVCLI